MLAMRWGPVCRLKEWGLEWGVVEEESIGIGDVEEEEEEEERDGEKGTAAVLEEG